MWPDFDLAAWFSGFLPGIHDLYDFEVSDRPDFILYSVFGPPPPKGPWARIFYTGENRRPELDKCEWAFGFDHEDSVRDPRYFRLPLYTVYGCGRNLVKRYFEAERIRRSKKRFCAFIYSNADAPERVLFFGKLSRYKRVDAPGRVMNNMPGFGSGRDNADWRREKIAFLRDYKFVIAFENSSYPGYTTEKLTDPMLARGVPIYWGNPLVHMDFNPRSFVNAHEHDSLDAVVQRVIELDRDDELYDAVLREPYYHGNEPSRFVDALRILERFRLIFESGPRPWPK